MEGVTGAAVTWGLTLPPLHHHHLLHQVNTALEITARASVLSFHLMACLLNYIYASCPFSFQSCEGLGVGVF